MKVIFLPTGEYVASIGHKGIIRKYFAEASHVWKLTLTIPFVINQAGKIGVSQDSQG
jgi:hypothetical protein